MQFWGSQFLHGLKSLEELRTWTSRGFTSLTQILNGKVMFSDNIFCQIVSFPDIGSVSHIDVKVEHRLGIVPIGVFLIYSTQFAEVHAGTIPWTNQAIYISGTFSDDMKIIIIGA